MPRSNSGHFSFVIFKVVIDFSKIPFIRLLIPFVIGIIVYLRNDLDFNPTLCLLISFVVLTSLFIYSNLSRIGAGKIYFLIASDVFLFFSACYAAYFFQPKNSVSYYAYYSTAKEVKWTGVVDEVINEKENFVKAVLIVESMSKEKTTGKVLTYFKKPIDKSKLIAGRKLEINSTITDVPLPLNPYEFNYKNYLANKGINYQTFVDTGSLNFLNEYAGGLKYWGVGVKLKMVDFLNSGILSPEAAQLCSALITGYDNEISRETINSFAHSGTLHVLSVSGLHTGILFAVLLFILNWFDKYNRFKIVKLIILLVGLWIFVFIAGFSPPIMRAAIMLSLIAIGKYYYNYYSNASINIMGVSAFILLLFDPYVLFDVGFLLSYFALLGILIFEPLITELYNGKNVVIKKVWQLCSVSISAQITTLPVTLCFFHQLPLWFVFSNLLVIPLCTAIMFLGVLFILKISLVATLINSLTKLVYFFVGLTDSPGLGYLEGIDFNFRDVLFLSGIIVLLFLLLRHRNFQLALGVLCLVIMWQTFNLLEVTGKKQHSALAIYQVNKAYFVEFKNGTKVLIDSTCNLSDYEFHVKNNQINYNYPNRVSCSFNYVAVDSLRFLVVKSERDLDLIHLINPNYVLVQNGIALNNDVLQKTGIRQIIADGSCGYKTIKELKQLCMKAGISFYATRENGFLELPL